MLQNFLGAYKVESPAHGALHRSLSCMHVQRCITISTYIDYIYSCRQGGPPCIVGACSWPETTSS